MRRWAFTCVALCGLALAGVSFAADEQRQADPGVELTVLRDDHQGHCTVRWTDPLDGRERQGPFACDPDRDPALGNWDYGWEASSWPWRGDLSNADGVGSPARSVIDTVALSGFGLLVVAGVGGTVRIVRHRGARRAATSGTTLTKAGARPPARTAASSLVKPVLLVTAGVAALVVSGGLFGVELPHAQQREKDFQAAAPCPGAPDATAADCLSTEPLTVKSVRVHGNKTSSYTADLTPPNASGATTVQFGGRGPLLDRLHPGDTVTGTLWRGDIIAIASEDGRTRQTTSANPTGDPTELVSVGVLLAVIGTTLVIAGLSTPYRDRADRTGAGSNHLSLPKHAS